MKNYRSLMLSYVKLNHVKLSMLIDRDGIVMSIS